MNTTIRPAEPRDVDAIIAMIRELAEFEKLTHLLQATHDKLHQHLFGHKPVIEAVVVENDAAQLVGYA